MVNTTKIKTEIIFRRKATPQLS